ncbi:DUF4232 domain-containing protein [Streptomyces sp. NBC_00210]|uniref:DUF4232 domain-containing protein n=1 Tax=unclassified Streptomyces TaxID=2593676 RepID=UPI00324366F4
MRKTTIAATTLLAALSLNACQSSDNSPSKPDAAAPSSPADIPKTPAADKSGKTAQPSAGAKSTPQGSDNAGGNGKAGEKGKAGDSGPVTAACIGANTKVTVTRVSRPINHLLLTMTNTGSKACNAYHAPLLRFDDAQAVTQIMDDSKPQTVVTLSPGESAYASILLSSGDGSGGDGRTAKNLGVFFAPRNGSGSTNTPPDELKLPAGTHIDDKAAVSYWQSTMDDALTY